MFNTLREANIARQIEWDTKSQMDLSYSGNELAGESGELVQAVFDIMNGGDDMEAVIQEIGDVAICCDLLGARLDLDLPMPEPIVGYSSSYAALMECLVALSISVGMVCNTVKKQERARFGMVGARGSIDDLRRDLLEVLCICNTLASSFETSVAHCAAYKFNITSEKYGLKTRMVV